MLMGIFERIVKCLAASRTSEQRERDVFWELDRVAFPGGDEFARVS